MKTVLLVDDHVLFRQSLRSLVSQRLPQGVYVEAGSLHTALKCLQQHTAGACATSPAGPVDLVLLDLTLKDSRGLLTLQRLQAAHPGQRVLVLTGEDDAELFEAVRAAGAVGVLSKSADAAELMAAVCQALQDGPRPRRFEPGVSPLSAAESVREGEAFSGRQADVLRLLLQGKSNKLICRELALSESTVKTHLQAVFRKLEVNSRTQAVVAAGRIGWSAGH